MKMSFVKCEEILKTLPIGFYAGRRIETTLDKKEETSYYSPMEDKIVISYPIIAHRLEAMPETSTCTDEEAVRSMLYHEVSHAILTPANEFDKITPQVNIVEDERIETVLQDYYHEVDFRKQLYDIHGGHAPVVTDAEGAFFNAVRFGLGTPDVQNAVKYIMKEYAPLNGSSRNYSGHPCVYDYECDIRRLWNLVQKMFKSNPQSFQPQEGENTSENKSQESMPDMSESETSKNSEKTAKSKSSESPLTVAEIKKIIEKSLTTKQSLNTEEAQKVASFQKSAELIIGNFNKKNKGGNGINAYSGVFNPRAVAREDYRYFERTSTAQGNNKFGTCHLNLIIDCSGSFHNNVPMTNGILSALSEIERKNRNFSMDVAFINDKFHICESKKERKMAADGGNDVPDNMKEIMIKMQKPNSCNYNIILFDGDAFSDSPRSKDTRKTFRAFDMKQTTLITDPYNERYIGKFSSTKVVVTKNYTKELTDHILKALTVAFG